MASATMHDVTEIFDRYRVSVRSVWNTAFWSQSDFRNWDSQNVFEDIARRLFDHLVLFRLEQEFPFDLVFRQPIPFFRLAPTSLCGCPIMIARPTPEVPTGLWNDPVNRVNPGEVEMQFVDFFDWNLLDYRDYQYYRVSIAAFAT